MSKDKTITIEIDPHPLFDYAFEIDPKVTMQDIEEFIDLYREGLQATAIQAVNVTVTESMQNWIARRIEKQQEPDLPELDDDE